MDKMKRRPLLGIASMMKHKYKAVITRIEDDWFMATAPDLPGAVSQGRDLNEALANLKEAMELLLHSYRDNATKDPAGYAMWQTIRRSWRTPPGETS
jgi:predicted RNase H-like HicB family nuclease